MALYLGKDLVSASSGSGGVTIKNQDKTFTENGSYAADSGYTGLGVVKVDVQPKNQDKNITANGTYRADSGYTGLGEVVVEVPMVSDNSKLVSVIDRTVTEMTEKDLEGVTSIGAYAFHLCLALESVVIPTSVTRIGVYAFEGCNNLSIYYKGTKDEWSTVTVGTHGEPLRIYYYSENEPTESGNFWHYVDGVVTAWSAYVEPNYSEGLVYSLNGGAYTVGGIGSCTDTDVIIPSSFEGIPVTSIGGNAFYNCSTITSVVIPESVTYIGYSSFSNCTNLTSINIPDGVTIIDMSTFNNCVKLTSIKIPNSVTSIDSYAFGNCSGMQFYDFSTHTSIPTLLNTNIFQSIPSTCEIRVPVSLYDEWIAATNWSNYASYIVAV